MKQLDALHRFATVSVTPDAANEAQYPQGAAAVVDSTPRAAGWDPFEVWRTRVRDARRDAEGPAGR